MICSSQDLGLPWSSYIPLPALLIIYRLSTSRGATVLCFSIYRRVHRAVIPPPDTGIFAHFIFCLLFAVLACFVTFVVACMLCCPRLSFVCRDLIRCEGETSLVMVVRVQERVFAEIWWREREEEEELGGREEGRVFIQRQPASDCRSCDV